MSFENPVDLVWSLEIAEIARDSQPIAATECVHELSSLMFARYPEHLADHVHSQLATRKTPHPPARETLARVLEVLYFTSLKSEETETVSCRVAFLPRQKPDPKPPARIVKDRWQSFPLKNALPLTVRNLAKISKAVDPWVSTLAIDSDSDEQLWIWGLIDQSVHYSTYVIKETQSGPEMPGAFQAIIQGVGDIAVYKGYTFLGSLHQDVLIQRQQRVFQHGPVHEKLMPPITKLTERVRDAVGRDEYDRRDHWDASLQDSWVSAMCRILIGIRRYEHGGAVLICDSKIGLAPKYSINYPRLSDAITRANVLYVKNAMHSDVIHEKYLEKGKASLPCSTYVDEFVSRFTLKETEDEITGCIRFLCSLARVDGLIWLSSDLTLRGFGVEITSTTEPRDVYISEDSTGAKSKAIDIQHFGTRHRSMIRHCAMDATSVGFVVSQDGDVRAVTRVGQKVLLWENVRLHSIHNLKSKKTNRRPDAK